MNETQAILVKSALAALTQNATFPEDVEFAKARLREALAAQQPFALDGACAHPRTRVIEYDYLECESCGAVFPPRK